MANNFEQQTDTHLAKYYNELLIGVLAECTKYGMEVGMVEHVSTLKAYFSAVKRLIISTRFLFDNTYMKNPYINSEDDKFKGQNQIPIKTYLDYVTEKVELVFRIMPHNKKARTTETYNKVKDTIFKTEAIIWEGLQDRNMLVRISSQTPRGKDGIEYWGKKPGMNKGLLGNQFGD